MRGRDINLAKKKNNIDMKNSTYLIILLAIGLVFTSYKWVTSASGEAEETVNEGNVAIEAIMTRASVRSYTSREISKETEDTLLRAAMAAPSAMNKQPWRFVVIRDKGMLTKISEEFKNMSMMSEAGLAVVVCGDMDAAIEGEGREYWVQDASAATENLLLAAHAMGLGAVWCGVYPIEDRVKEMSELLGMPGNIVPLNCVAVGYPAGETAVKDKWHPENIRQEVWSHGHSKATDASSGATDAASGATDVSHKGKDRHDAASGATDSTHKGHGKHH